MVGMMELTGNPGKLPFVRLSRLETSNQGTFGKVEGKGFTAFSGELQDKDNLPNVSCIPKGTYNVVWTYSPIFKREMYLIQNVRGRNGVRIHSANFMGDDSLGFHKQVNGCIALGEKLGKMDGQKALLLSRPAVRRFEDLMKGKPFILEIR